MTAEGTPVSIVIIEDEADIAASVAARLRNEGFAVAIAADGPSGVELVNSSRPDLVVLDLMLPGLDGLEVCRRIQAERPVAVVMLTARDDETDMLIGLGVGADDYLTKPFSPRELVARIRAILRRIERERAGTPDAGAPASAGAGERMLAVGDLELDVDRRRVRISGEEVHLTATEFDLLAFLAARPGVVCTREQLLVEVWGYADGTGPRTVDSHVRDVRRKIGAERIRTVHGVGYALTEQLD